MTAIHNADQRRILARYATGDDLAQIVKDTRLAHDLVSGTVSTLCAFNRQRAAALVRDYDAGRQPATASVAATVAASKPPAKQIRTAVPAPARPEPQHEPEPEPQATIKPEPRPARTRTLDRLLADAENSDVPALQRAAEKIRTLADELATAVEASMRQATARARVAEAKAALEAAEKELRALTEKAAPPRRTRSGVDWQAIRAWATKQGLPCPATGKVPGRIVAQYHATHREAA